VTPLLLVAFVLVAAAAWPVIVSWRVRRVTLDRLSEKDDRAPGVPAPSAPQRWLGRWLTVAGYRRRGAAVMFVTATAVSAASGVIAGQAYRFALMERLVAMVATVPGGAGEALAAVLDAGDWIMLAVLTLVPTLVVRAARRARVRAVEQDLPLALELCATMAEAGLGFDAAIAKVVRAQGSHRPLIADLTLFQYDMLAGLGRTQALRQLARRVDVPSVTTFTSALVQAEEVGASLSETLRHQADDLRQRRREDALLRAQALPVKLVFPLVICFLPGIFLSTLAPVIYQMIQVANGVLRSGR